MQEYSFKARVIAVVMAASGPFTAPVTAAETGVAAVKFTGDTNWQATCAFHKENGNVRSLTRKGRAAGPVESMGMRDVTGGSCELAVEGEGTVKVTFTGLGAIGCPFTDAGQCIRIFPAGTSSFTFGKPA